MPGFRLWAACGGLLLLACGAPQPADPPPISVCAAPTGPAARALRPPLSTVSAELWVSKKRLQRELAKQVPQVLAEEKRRSIGAPGRLSYEIQRGALRISVENDQLVVATKLRGDIEICKPFGPICARYGTCQPSWKAVVTLPLGWQEPPEALTRVSLERGCVLSPVGYDATAQVREITDREARKVAARINRELRQGQTRALKELTALSDPLKLRQLDGPDAAPMCIAFDVQALEYSLHEAADRDALAVVAQMRGHLAPTCEAQGQAPTPKYAPQLAPETDASVALPLAFSAIEERLSRAAGGRVQLRAFGGAQGENVLFVGVPAQNECGVSWLQATPKLSPGGLIFHTAEIGTAADWLHAQRIAKTPQLEQLERGLIQLKDAAFEAEAFGKQNRVHVELPSRQSTAVQVDENALSFVVGLSGLARWSAR